MTSVTRCRRRNVGCRFAKRGHAVAGATGVRIACGKKAANGYALVCKGRRFPCRCPMADFALLRARRDVRGRLLLGIYRHVGQTGSMTGQARTSRAGVTHRRRGKGSERVMAGITGCKRHR